MKLFRWVNSFHNTECYSTLNQETMIDAMHEEQVGYITKKHKNYRKYISLINKLCPHNWSSCRCGAFNQCKSEG